MRGEGDTYKVGGKSTGKLVVPLIVMREVAEGDRGSHMCTHARTDTHTDTQRH